MYRLYIDEVGTDSFSWRRNERQRYLSLTGVIISGDHNLALLDPKLTALKQKYFPKDPDDPKVVLHRTDMYQCKNDFRPLRNPTIAHQFYNELADLVQETEFKVITALIDKKWMRSQTHWQKTHPYHYLLEILIEKYAQYLKRVDEIGDVMPECRDNNGKKDKLLQEAFRIVKNNGTNFVHKDTINSAIPSKQLKFRTKKDNIAGLQLADLIGNPSHLYIAQQMGLNHQSNWSTFCKRIVKILVSEKYDRSPYNQNVKGYGIKHLP